MTEFRLRRSLLTAVGLCGAWAMVAHAMPHSSTATRTELNRWLAELRASRVVNVDAPLRWEYLFSDADGRKLEALSVALVRAGYSIVTLQPGAASGTLQLRVAKVELHTASTLERRNRELESVARAHGVGSYDGVDFAPVAR